MEATSVTLSIALAGSGGSGVMTCGTMLLEAAARAGLYGLMVRTSGPQIRGGEAAALLRLGVAPMDTLDDRFDLLLAIDWENVNRFADEIPLGPSSLLIGDPDQGEPPDVFRTSGARYVPLPLAKTAKSIPGSWVNMIALGLAGALANIPQDVLESTLARSWKRTEAALQANLAALRAGIEAARGVAGFVHLDGGIAHAGTRWLISGNEAAGYGALRGGVRFVAAYPITPATELLEWMAPALAKVGGTLLQAEDELASINMIVGASYGGVPALTATAGPGLSLMMEGIGLAVGAEVPIVVVDVMRGGPSTGIPAKSEQGDLACAVSGLHGDAPRIVVAPTSIGDCLSTTQWAVHLAEALQAPAIVLSDQFMGQSRAVIDTPAEASFAAERLVADADTPEYKRYRDTPSGVSPMAIPGTRGVAYTADGLEHTEAGIPTSQARDHRRQLDKRARKLERFDYGALWADVFDMRDLRDKRDTGDTNATSDADIRDSRHTAHADAAIITFGSAAGPVREAAARAARHGVRVRVIALRLLAPAQPERMAAALTGVTRVMVVEQNHGAQLYRYLRAMYDLPGRAESYHRPGPLPLRPGELADAIVAWSSR